MKFDIFRNFRRKSRGEIALYCAVSALFMVVALSYIYVLFWMVMAACKTHMEVVMSPFALPEKWHWSHFIEAISLLEVNGHNFFDMLKNSCWFSLVGVLYSQFVSLLFAYVAVKYTFPGSKHVYTFILIVMTLPMYGSGSGMYKLLYELNMIDSYSQILCGGVVTATRTLYYMAFFRNVSNTYMEAAKIDGANDYQVCYKIMMPQAKPIFGALFLTGWLAEWNSYSSALIYLPNKPVLTVGIYQFYTEMIYRARLDILFAACVLTVLPALILFTVFNKTITTSVSFGGLKG